jgi:pimeloyl-ACP methyl ester carboxylesterase
LLATIRESAAACAAQLHASGTDLGGYTWSEIAEDISDLRAALGTTRLRLVGFSSGTHAALAFLRRHGPETERVVMIGTEGPDHTRKLPSNVDLQLQQIAALVRADTALQPEIPDFLALMRQVLEKLEREPAFVEVLVPGVEAKVRGSVGRFALALLTAKSLKGPEEFGRLPLLYYSIARGDLEILTRVVQRRVGGPPTNALNYILDGASGVSAEREQRIVGEAQESLLGDAVNFPFPEIQSVWGYQDLGASFRQPVHSPVPALFATGTLDGNTPPHQAEEIRRGFQHSGRLLILNGGHDSPFTATAAWDPIVSFLRAESMPDTTIELPAPAFAPLRR